MHLQSKSHNPLGTHRYWRTNERLEWFLTSGSLIFDLSILAKYCLKALVLSQELALSKFLNTKD